MNNTLKTLVLTAFTLSVILITACDKDSLTITNEPVHIEITGIDFPDTVWTGAEYSVIIRAQLTGINLISSEPFYVGAEIGYEESPGSSLRIDMNDKGIDGDNIPGDFEFTNTVENSLLAGSHSGPATVTVSINDGMFIPKTAGTETSPLQPFTIGEPVTVNFFIGGERNLPPVITGISGIGDTLFYDQGDSTLIFVTADDPNGNDDIASGIVSLIYPGQGTGPGNFMLHDDGLAGDVQAGDGILTSAIQHSLISNFGDGLYTLQITVSDNARNGSEDFIHEFHAVAEQVNYPPEIVSISAPDSLQADGSLTLIEVTIADSNGLGDVSEVYFRSKRPDGTSSPDKFRLWDDGSTVLREGDVYSGDTTAGDGIYAITITIGNSAMKGTWEFTFVAIDKSGANDQQVHTIVVY